MAKAKLTLKQEADMLSAVNQIKELEAAGKKLKKEADELRSKVKAMMDKKQLEEMEVGTFTVRHCCQQPVRQPCISGDTPVPL